MQLAMLLCTLDADFVCASTCCTASRTHATLSQQPKAKASSRPVFAVAPGPQHRARIRRAGWKSVLQRVKTSTAETGEDDVLTDPAPAIVGIHALRMVCVSCMRPCLSLCPGPDKFHREKDHPDCYTRNRSRAPEYAITNARYRPLVSARRLVLLASTWQTTLHLVSVSLPAKRPIPATAQQ